MPKDILHRSLLHTIRNSKPSSFRRKITVIIPYVWETGVGHRPLDLTEGFLGEQAYVGLARRVVLTNAFELPILSETEFSYPVMFGDQAWLQTQMA